MSKGDGEPNLLR
jgi:hypothetical protein